MPTTQDNFNGFYASEASIASFVPATLNGRSIYRFAPPYGTTRIPLHIRTGAQSLGAPTERKKFTQVEFHGKGTVWVRIYVDGIYIGEWPATMTESPSKDRRIGIPTGIRGYTMDLEFAGDADIRAVEYSYTPMQSTS